MGAQTSIVVSRPPHFAYSTLLTKNYKENQNIKSHIFLIRLYDEQNPSYIS